MTAGRRFRSVRRGGKRLEKEPRANLNTGTGSKMLSAALNYASCFGLVLHLAFASKISSCERMLIILVDMKNCQSSHGVDAISYMRLPHAVLGKAHDVAYLEVSILALLRGW